MNNLFLNLYLFVYGSGSFISVFLYWFLAEGTIKFFSGDINPTSIFWVRTVASGDLLVSFICLKGLLGNSEMKKLAVQSNFLYGLFHFGSFWYADKFIAPHKPFMSVQYLPSILFVAFALIWWVFIFPPKDEVKNKTV
eukprot:gene4146-7456_t